MKAIILRTVSERQRIVRETLAGRECQLSARVPNVKTTRLVVITPIGGRAKIVQKGETNRIRMKRLVNAGLVVADVAVLWVDKKSVSCRSGSSMMLHLIVRLDNVSTISSRLFWCFVFPSENLLSCPFTFSPVKPVEDRGEYLLENMPRIKITLSITGPAHLVT